MSRKAAASAVALLIGLAQASAFDTDKLGQHGSMWLEDLMSLIGGTIRLKRQVKSRAGPSQEKGRRGPVQRQALPWPVGPSRGRARVPLYLRLRRKVSAHPLMAASATFALKAVTREPVRWVLGVCEKSANRYNNGK